MKNPARARVGSEWSCTLNHRIKPTTAFESGKKGSKLSNGEVRYALNTSRSSGCFRDILDGGF
jgi:hypothetical protein